MIEATICCLKVSTLYFCRKNAVTHDQGVEILIPLKGQLPRMHPGCLDDPEICNRSVIILVRSKSLAAEDYLYNKAK